MFKHTLKKQKKYKGSTRQQVWTVLSFSLLVPSGVYSLFLPKNTPVIDSTVTQVFRTVGEAFDWAEVVPPVMGQTASPIHWGKVIFVLWVVGMAISLGSKYFSYLVFRKGILRWSTTVSHTETLQRFERCKKEQRIRRSIKLLCSSEMTSPMLMGCLCPMILLPTEELSDEHQETVFRHELAHYKRNDLWLLYFQLIVTSLYWFHPLVWVLSRQGEKDMEHACDERVLAISKEKSRQRYAKTILHFMTEGNTVKTPLTTSFTQNYRETYKRMEDILNTVIRKKGKMILFVLLATVVLLGMLSACSTKEETFPVENTLPLANGAETTMEEAAVRTVGEGEYALMVPTVNPEFDGQLQWPVLSGYIGTVLGGYPGHTGVDFNGSGGIGAPVLTSASGTVIKVHYGWTGYGHHIIIDHGNGFTTLYAMMDEIMMKVGDQVVVGQQIGTVGNTGNSSGPHLHFELKYEGQMLDPEDYFPEEALLLRP